MKRTLSFQFGCCSFLLIVLVACSHNKATPDFINQTQLQKNQFQTQGRANFLTNTNHNSPLILIKDKLIDFPKYTTNLSGKEKQNLKAVATLILKNSRLFNHVEIVGHAGQEGSDDNSLNISRKRALNVSEVLKSSGLSASQILTSWRGNTEPINRTLATDGNNSRVELKFYGIQKSPEFDHFIEQINQQD